MIPNIASEGNDLTEMINTNVSNSRILFPMALLSSDDERNA